jgi:ABC-type nickel/cobalt efflux system permease component RcnA
MVRMAVVAGIIPCPLSITIMLLAVTQNIYFIGLLTVGGIALGIITVLSTVGILIIKTKETLRQISDDHHGEGWAHTLHHAMDYLGAVLIILLGLGLGFLYMPTL